MFPGTTGVMGDISSLFQGVVSCFKFAFLLLVHHVSVNSKPDHPIRATPGDSHVFTARGSGFPPTFFARDVGGGGLN